MIKKFRISWKIFAVAGLFIFWAPLFMAFPAAATGYIQTNLVSNGFVPAAVTDPNLVNPWGISYSPTSPFWISDNGTGLATLYRGTGQIVPLVVTIPPTGGAAVPTGQVFNTTSDFNGDQFIFATEAGTIAGWRSALGTTAELPVDKSGAGAVYKGLAMGNNATGNFLYATNFNSGAIDVFDRKFIPTTLAGGFIDPNLPAGYAPFNVANIGGNLYVTYAMTDGAKHDDVPGPGHGFVDVFDVNGNLLKRLITQGPLNSPWGLALAPTNFGEFSNDLLVGNFGDGRINAFDPVSGALIGSLTDTLGNPIIIDGLWGLLFGNGTQAGDPNTLFFTAGLNSEQDGLFGSLAPVPAPSTLMLLGSGLTGLLTFSRARKKRA